MAVTATVKYPQYSFTMEISKADKAAIKKSKELFKVYLKKGIIVNSSHENSVWMITDETESCGIYFQIDELEFSRYGKPHLGCSLTEYIETMKVLTTASFGADIKTLQFISRGCRKLLEVLSGTKDMDVLTDYAYYLLDFLELLPGESVYRNTLIDELSDLAEYTLSSTKGGSSPRNLATYQTYFLFTDRLYEFWSIACTEDKLFYFPVYLWWNLTSILPLRPSEFVLIPRDCIEQKGTKHFLTIRRTRLKGEKSKAEYSIEKDYEKCVYEIPENLVFEIENYIKGTAVGYESDIFTLFSSIYHYQYLQYVRSDNSKHFTYGNLRDCLRYFYKRILRDKMVYTIREKSQEIGLRELYDHEIERISLGDSRHVAMINLIISGGNPVMCKELAGHRDISISANYYANIKNFVEVLSFSRCRKDAPNYEISTLPYLLSKEDMPLLEDGGRCASEKVKSIDYRDCLTTISLDGKMLHCESCCYYVRPRNAPKISLQNIIFAEQERESDLHTSFDFLLKSVETVRKGLGYQDTIQSALLRCQSSALQYSNVLYQKYKLEKELP